MHTFPDAFRWRISVLSAALCTESGLNSCKQLQLLDLSHNHIVHRESVWTVVNELPMLMVCVSRESPAPLLAVLAWLCWRFFQHGTRLTPGANAFTPCRPSASKGTHASAIATRRIVPKCGWPSCPASSISGVLTPCSASSTRKSFPSKKRYLPPFLVHLIMFPLSLCGFPPFLACKASTWVHFPVST